MIEIIDMVKMFFTAGIAVICLILSRFRYQENIKYANKYVNDERKLVMKLLITWLLKGISIIFLIGFIMNKIDAFVAFYIFSPLLIAINIIFYENREWILGFMIFIKGLYYFGLIIISMVQFVSNDMEGAVLAVGFTIALAIFETLSAVSDGINKMRDAKA